MGQCVHAVPNQRACITYTLTGLWHSFRNTLGIQCGVFPPLLINVGHSQQRAAGSCSAAAEFGQEIGHAEEDPHHQEVGAEGQQGQRVQETGVQPEVTHRQQAAKVLLDHPLPCPNSAESWEGGRKKVWSSKKCTRKGKVVEERLGTEERREDEKEV